ncbi:hypothetical protein JY651_33305 [Pyxidicoccus parkwayensis]|uniref:DUF2125 domain-containing protein n=1 Tax=Pyxidicoccus parkwayensis TaxID=2813578 RepID=A0ABX7NRE9_9BACT|nr:hypothetical protein [Pyxidicoccus parkwaysis]QSQ20125.1 hypothetical protein JY651_33305 [Pyxidicoccus parkwaysis]
MFSSLVLAATLAAAPAPRSAASALTVVHVPRLDAMTGLSAFLQRAGTYSAVLRPNAWRAELHPFLVIDPTKPETLSAVGLDPAGPATVSLREDGRVSCLRVTDVKLFQTKAAEAISAAGGEEPKPTVSKGVTTVSVKREAGGAMGYALKGQDVCAYGATDSGGPALLKEAVKLVGKAPAPDARLGKVTGVAFIASGGTVVGLDGTGNVLNVEGTALKLPLPPFQSKATSPYGAMKPGGMLFSRVAVSPAGVSQAVGSLSATIQSVCAACPEKQVQAMTDTVAKQLTGNMLVNMDNVQVRGSLRLPDVRFFAVRQALAAEVTDAAAVKNALAPMGSFPGAKTLADGWSLPLKGGSVFVRLKGNQLVLGNDEAVTQATVAALPETGAKLERAADFSVDPKKLARGLGQVSLSDVLADQQLAALFAVSSELGPLLEQSERITGWMDSAPGGAHRFSLTWTLPAAK